jgi:hypothetical protein
LFSDPADLALSNRLAINKAIAGRTDLRNISIGDARLSPTAPLEVRYEDNVGHSDNPIIGGNKVVQSWYCNNNMVAYMSCSGHVVSTTASVNPLFVEGILAGALAKPNSISSATSALLTVYENGISAGRSVYVTNRDTNLGAIAIGTYVVAIKLGNEYRPIWVSC